MSALLPSLLVAGTLLTSVTAQRDDTGFAVKAGRFLTVDTDPVHGGVMLVEKGKIKAIGKDVSIPLGMKVLDFGDATMTPGFVDLHHHVSGSDG